MRTLLLLAVIAASALSCALGRGGPPERSLSAQVIAGRYGAGGHIAYLELEPSGEYESFIVNGMTAGGCATFEGAGVSSGRWTIRSGALHFHPIDEPSDLVVSFLDATAVPTGDGLSLSLVDRAGSRSGERAEQSTTLRVLELPRSPVPDGWR